MRFIKELYIENRLFYAITGVIILFVLSFPLKWLLPVSKIALLAVIISTLFEYLWVFNRNVDLVIKRTSPKLLSLGDQNPIELLIKNNSSFSFKTRVIEELPYQLQTRDFEFSKDLLKFDEFTIPYTIIPKSRGLYNFGNTLIFISSQLGFISRRYNAKNPSEIHVYPSIVQMKKYELAHLNKLHQFLGIKKIRRIGHSYDFEQIKEYVQGDDYRSLNWKATGRYHRLMVNQYQDQSAQPVYCLLDKSRYMKMPFNGMSLLDYSINTSLVICNTALKKNDKTGLITFSDKINTAIKADNKPFQLKRILEALYNEEEQLLESNYELLYSFIRKSVSQRSLFFLFSNIESVHALKRILPLLMSISKNHLLVMIFFENHELSDFATKDAESLKDIYLRASAQRTITEKMLLIQTLRQNGIHTIFTQPKDLTMNVLNKYLEFKARGMI